MGFNGPVDLDFNSVFRLMDEYDMQTNRIKLFEDVHRVYKHMQQIRENEAKAKGSK